MRISLLKVCKYNLSASWIDTSNLFVNITCISIKFVCYREYDFVHVNIFFHLKIYDNPSQSFFPFLPYLFYQLEKLVQEAG